MARRANQRDRGVIKDRKTGVVLARRRQHSHLQLLTSIPNNHPDYPDADLPPFNMPDEIKHLLAIHVFDNLYPGLPLPPGEGETWTVTSSTGETWTVNGSRYRLVNPTGDTKPHGGNGEVWLPWVVPAEAVATADGDVDGVPDVDDLDDAQLAALQRRIEERIADEAMLNAMDPQAKPSKPEWVRWREERRGEAPQ
ncbi:hypothetical protein [Gordonia sp. (in: high G+C Gram-positive bacteria)]|uniref:hypothetical protein n=1 Tax=Gordonia sp. (in: high G+C Gram-positive bacteria) TaxID=84139 RepID=UPI003342B796